MKRLLIYMFLLLGLGVVFSVNSYSAVYCVDNKIGERIANFKPDYPKRENEFFYFSAQSGTCIASYFQVTFEQYNYFKNLFSREKLKIAKTDSSQTQKVLSNNDLCIDPVKQKDVTYGTDDLVIGLYWASKRPNVSPSNTKCKYRISENQFPSSYRKFTTTYKTTGNIISLTTDEVIKFTKKDNIFIKKNNQLVPVKKLSSNKKVNVAKVEPSQTQKIKLDLIFCKNDSKREGFGIYIRENVNGKCPNTGYETKDKLVRDSSGYLPFDVSNLCYHHNSPKGFQVRSVLFANCGVMGATNIIYNSKNNQHYTYINNIKIAKAEPASKPKKKVEVVKKEPKQEEFKPKKTNQDTDPPIIEVAENITVSDSAYEIGGNVKDKSKKIFIEVDGQTIPVKKGKFKLKRFSPVDEQIKIVAIDQWGNRSKPKIVNVTIDIKNIEVAEKIEPLNPTKMRSRKNKDRIALIIGIEKYDQIPSASYANLDAKFFYEYARKGFGVSKSNIKLLIDEDADLVKSLGTLNKWLPGKIKSNQTELIIFFAGHGLASNDGKELYLLPQDSDPDLLDRTALSRTELFQEIIGLNPKSVTMFMDTCYSGISRDEKMLLASARPVRIVADEQDGIPDNFTIFSASQLEQISSGLNEAKHGIFSYYLMKGLEGKADSNNDKKITNGELLAYLDENVSQKALELGRQQNPSLAGDPDKLLINY